jgi:hypothetical protein
MSAHVATAHRKGAALFAFTTAAALLLTFGTPAGAALHATVPLGTSAQYAVLGASTVTNTGASTLNGSLGVSPGTAITGFPPGKVIAPGTTNRTNAAAAKARADLTAAYLNAQGRAIDATVSANLANLHLQAGVYAGPSHGALQLTGPLVLDGAGNANSVFIFQTNSSLITASSSTVSLINGAQECNVFWQVGSSATLGTGSVFTGNILALTSISVTNSVTVHGRALARNGAVTLDTDTFTRPTCAAAPPGAPSAPGSGAPTLTTSPGGTGGGATPNAGPGTGTGTDTGSNGPPVAGPPRTDATPVSSGGSFPWQAAAFVALFGGAGTAGAVLSRRRVLAPVATEGGVRTRPWRR